MGKIFEKILTGENKAYFPNILLTYKQKINVNFGQEKFFYDYSGYEKFDLPEAEVKNIYSVTNNAIQFFETYRSVQFIILFPKKHILQINYDECMSKTQLSF